MRALRIMILALMVWLVVWPMAGLMVGPMALAESSLAAWRGKVNPGPLQARIDKLKTGDVLELTGVEQGPILISTPGVTLDGLGRGVIDGQGRDTVVVVAADNVTIRGLTIRHSGEFNPRVDAGVAVTSANHVRLEKLKIEEVLFGIDISDAEQVVIRGCEISSKKAFEFNNRGDAIRIWSSKDIQVEGNHWTDARDAVAWYSERVRFIGNRAERTRYSVHAMYSKSLFVEGNVFENNSVGMFIMYGEGTTVLNNTVRRSAGVTGIGLGLKETSGVYAKGNSFVYCATGILVDNSPWEPSTRNWILQNELKFNDVGVLLANDRHNEFRQNVFESNRHDVDSEQRRKSPSEWIGNYWGDYEGFDRDGDGIGDTPHVPRKYGDLLTGSHPSARYFAGSPVLAIISLIERLVPLTEPIELLEDPEPRRLRAADLEVR